MNIPQPLRATCWASLGACVAVVAAQDTSVTLAAHVFGPVMVAAILLALVVSLRGQSQPDPGDEPAHVLEWFPADIAENGQAAWELRTWGEHGPGEYQDDGPRCELPRDAPPAELAAWVSERVGYLVTLAPGTQQIKPRRFGRWRTEPIYYVRPVVMPPVSARGLEMRG